MNSNADRPKSKRGGKRAGAGRKPTAANWPAVRADYSAGSLSVREVASLHGITESVLRRRAKAEAWPRTAKHIVPDGVSVRAWIKGWGWAK